MMHREQVIERVDDWEKRLNQLIDQLHEWHERLPDAEHKEFLRGEFLQVDEGILQEFGIPPRMLPHCAILHGRNRLSIVAGPLWIIGANGRVHATTNKRQFVLVDLGGKDGAPSDWQIVTSQMLATYRPFTEGVFQELVLQQGLQAA